MRTRTLVVAGTGAAAAAYLFDPRRGRARRDRVRGTLRSLVKVGDAQPTAPLPENLAPERSVPREPEPDVRVIPRSTQPPSRKVPTSFATAPPPRGEQASAAPTKASADDTEIVRNVRTRLEERSDLGTDELVVDVVNGVAYLSGTLHDRQTFGEVVDLTGQVPGVRRVQSLLHLPDSESISRVLSGRRAHGDR
jgi:BON domain